MSSGAEAALRKSQAKSDDSLVPQVRSVAHGRRHPAIFAWHSSPPTRRAHLLPVAKRAPRALPAAARAICPAASIRSTNRPVRLFLKKIFLILHVQMITVRLSESLSVRQAGAHLTQRK